MAYILKAALLLCILQLWATQSVFAQTYDNTYKWSSVKLYGALPENAVRSGGLTNGQTIFVGRVLHQKAIYPARVIPERELALFDVGTSESSLQSYDVLTGSGNFTWIKSFDGFYENNAVSVGSDANGHQVFVCRVTCDQGLIPGRIGRTEKNCTVANVYTKCRAKDKYEILIKN